MLDVIRDELTCYNGFAGRVNFAHHVTGTRNTPAIDWSIFSKNIYLEACQWIMDHNTVPPRERNERNNIRNKTIQPFWEPHKKDPECSNLTEHPLPTHPVVRTLWCWPADVHGFCGRTHCTNQRTRGLMLMLKVLLKEAHHRNNPFMYRSILTPLFLELGPGNANYYANEAVNGVQPLTGQFLRQC